MEKVRRIKIFEELDGHVHEGKFAQARKICEREQKRGDQSDALLVRRIVILLSLPEPARNEAGRTDLAALNQKDPPLKELASLVYLDNFLCKSSASLDTLHEVWVKAAGAPLQDESFMRGWFETKFEQQRWKDAQQAALLWKRNYPKRREPFFLHILCSHLVFTRFGYTETEKNTSKMLSCMCLAQAAKDVPSTLQGQEAQSPPRALHNSEDLLFLTTVYKAQGKYAEALSILEDTRTGFVSSLGNRSFELFAEMLQLNEFCGRLDAQWLLCYEALRCIRPQSGMSETSYNFGEQADDWKVWSAFVTACSSMISQPGPSKDSSYLDRTCGFLQQHSAEVPRSRNALLATVKLYSSKAVRQFVKKDRLLEACSHYFSTFAAKTSCFKDLQPYVAQLDRREQDSLLTSMTSTLSARAEMTEASLDSKFGWIIAEITLLKFEYHFVISHDKLDTDNGVLAAFVSNCLRLYKLALQWDFGLPASDRQPGDDAAILAAMALLRLSRSKPPSTLAAGALLQCIAILESILMKSKHNYDALLLLVRLYMFLGIGSKAIERYYQMSIKNLQFVTISWLLFSRISTIHPYPVIILGADTGKRTIDPLKEINSILRWHTQALRLSDQALSSLQTNGLWLSMQACVTTKEALSDGLMMPLLVGEACRMQRYRYPQERSPIKDDLLQLPRVMKDTRDRSAFPNYEAAGQLNCEECLPSVEIIRREPQGKLIAANIDQAHIWNYLHGCGNTADVRKPQRSRAVSFEQEPDGRTSVERIVHEICQRLDTAIHIIQTSMNERKWTKEMINDTTSCLSSVLRLYDTATDDASLEDSSHFANPTSTGLFEHPCWLLIHSMFVCLEICLFGHRFVKEISEIERQDDRPLPPWLKDLLKTLQEKGTAITTHVQDRAISCRDEIRTQAYQDRLHQVVFQTDDIGQALTGVLTDPLTPSSFCTMLTDGWVDALDGIIHTKVCL